MVINLQVADGKAGKTSDRAAKQAAKLTYLAERNLLLI